MTTRHTTSPRQWQAWGAAAILLSPATALAGSPGFIVSGLDAVPTEEGGEASFTVALAAKPGSDVFLDVTSSLVNEVTIVAEDPGPFTPLNWNTPRRYWAIGLDDEVEDGDAKVTVSVKAGPGSDGAYLAALATFDTENLDDERTLTFESDYVDCDGPKTEDIYDGRIVGLIYNRKLAQQDGAKPDWFDANPVQDDRVFAENSDKYYLSLRTLHVVLRNTYRKNMTNLETEGLLQSYARAAHEIHTTSRGMVELDFDQVALTTEFGDNSFIDDDPAPGVTAKFVDYPKLAFALAFAGYNYDEYDLISVSVAFTDDIPSHVRTEVAYAVPPPDFKYDVPFTNPETWKNDHTWTTRCSTRPIRRRPAGSTSSSTRCTTASIGCTSTDRSRRPATRTIRGGSSPTITRTWSTCSGPAPSTICSRSRRCGGSSRSAPRPTSSKCRAPPSMSTRSAGCTVRTASSA